MGGAGGSSPEYSEKTQSEKTHRDSLLSTFGSGRMPGGSKRLASLSPSPPAEPSQVPLRDGPARIGVSLPPSSQTLQVGRGASMSSAASSVVLPAPGPGNGEASRRVPGASGESYVPVHEPVNEEEVGPSHQIPQDYESLSKAKKWRKVPR
jgi:hypothetical protein